MKFSLDVVLSYFTKSAFLYGLYSVFQAFYFCPFPVFQEIRLSLSADDSPQYPEERSITHNMNLIVLSFEILELLPENMHADTIFWKVKANESIYILADAKIAYRFKTVYVS